MLAEAKPKPRRRGNESPCGAPVARSAAWVGPHIAEKEEPAPRHAAELASGRLSFIAKLAMPDDAAPRGKTEFVRWIQHPHSK